MVSPTVLAQASLFSHLVYGEDRLPASYRGSGDNGMDDRYDSYLSTLGWDVLELPLSGNAASYETGGLYSGGADQGDADAQALVAETVMPDGSKTVVLSFRGTDDIANAVQGQAFTKSGLQAYYAGFDALIDAVVTYLNQSGNGIDRLVVTGHSLGGSMVDAFMMSDRDRVSSKVDVEAVAIGSAGLHPDMIKDVDLSGYTLVSHDGDLVVQPELAKWWLPTTVLLNNAHPDGVEFVFKLPNLDRLPSGVNWQSTNYAVGLQHESKLYYENAYAIATDPLAQYFTWSKAIIGNGADADGDNVEATGSDADDPSANDSGSRTLTGTNVRDFILGREGNDALKGRGGNDLLSGGTGNDTVYGDKGSDRMHGGYGHDKLDGGEQNDWLWGGSGDDTLIGFHGDDALDGGSGKDRLFGQNGHDRLDGGDDGDLLRGGSGNDKLVGGGGNDTMFGDTGNDSLLGGDGSDQMRGGRGHDNVVGYGGNDRLYGEDGNDWIKGGDGHDSLYGADGSDRLVADEGNDRLYGGTGADRMAGGAGNDVLKGENGADFLRGDSGNDTLHGGAYMDTLVGGTGNDTLTGGTGPDVFVFAEGNGKDVITDYEAGFDRLQFNGLKSSDLSASQKGSDTVIVADGLEIRLSDVDLSDLTASDFVF